MKSLFSYSSLSAISMVSSAYLRLLIFLRAILIPACASSSPTFHVMYSQFSSVQFSHSVVSNSLRPHELQLVRPPCPSPTPRSSLKLLSIEWVLPLSHLIHCCPLLLQFPIPTSIRVFSNESAIRMRWPKYWSFSFSIIPSKEIPG